jgi:predicted secreted hydrolase
LPKDDGPHGVATEWWHYQGHLSAGGGRRYSFHAAVFLRQGVVRQTVFHGSLNEYRRGKRFTQQWRAEGVPSPQGAQGFEFAHGNWRVAGAGGAHRLRFGSEAFSLELELSDAGEPVLHGAAGSATPGVLDLGEAGVGHVYSRPRMKVKGTLGIGEAGSVEVAGEAWFDHQWGDFEPSRLAWSRFALQLDDGASVMLYQLFDRAGMPFRVAGTYTDADGRSAALAPAAVTLIPMGAWKSAASGVRYPAGWAIRIPQGDFLLKSLRQASEFDGMETTHSHYWDGAVEVAGGRAGLGFVEMSGYDRIPAVQPVE